MMQPAAPACFMAKAFEDNDTSLVATVLGLFQSQVSHVLTFFSKNIPTKILTAHPDICVLLFCTIYTTNHKRRRSDNGDSIQEQNTINAILFPQA